MRFIPALLIWGVFLTACSPSAPASDAASSEGTYSVASSSESVMKLAAPESASASTEATCLSQIGKAASDRLVERCIMVSPATHPPCNAANRCEMIQAEIDRSCAMYGPNEKKPAECAG